MFGLCEQLFNLINEARAQKAHDNRPTLLLSIMKIASARNFEPAVNQVKFALEEAMKAQRGSRFIPILFL
jgi:hypothetical protein